MPQEIHNFDGLVGGLDVVDDILLLLLIKIQTLIFTPESSAKDDGATALSANKTKRTT